MATNTGLRLGDYSTDRRMILLCGMSLIVGTGGAAGAWLLLHLIGFFTNLFWFGRLSWSPIEITDASVGPIAVVVPVLGALIVGLMARLVPKRFEGTAFRRPWKQSFTGKVGCHQR